MEEVHDEIEIEDMKFESETGKLFYPCPCGDLFETSLVSRLIIIMKRKSC